MKPNAKNVDDGPLWRPKAASAKTTQIAKFSQRLAKRTKTRLADYDSLWSLSIRDPEVFWSAVWTDTEVVPKDHGARVLENPKKMPGASFFPDARLNFAENLLRRSDDQPAIIAFDEKKRRREISFATLSREVSKVAQALTALGVGPGDRVAAFLPNVPETVIVMLATASLGAVFSSCSPDFGTAGVLDRFKQIEPAVLFATDGYLYNQKEISTVDKVKEIARALPTLRKIVRVPACYRTDLDSKIANSVAWKDFLAPFRAKAPTYLRLPFDHPLYILYSSGTTGAPKCIVHGAGGTLLQHLKEHKLQCDVRRGDRLLYFTTCGWMMWNWLVSALASEATIVLYDGSPLVGRGTILFDLVDKEQVTLFGTSAKFIDAVKKMGLSPQANYRFKNLRTICSTGSPLLPESFDWIYEQVKKDVCLSSISGGTDIVSCFVGGSPISPVYRGEIQKKGLGMAVFVYDENGRAVVDKPGDLVCTVPFPSMTIGFWNDLGGVKYRAAYFERFPNVWTHGDWVMETKRGGMVIYGRSDATLNPGGVRIGTAEIYRQVEQLEEIVESIAVGQDWDGDSRVCLFVRLAAGQVLDDALRDRIKRQIRDNTSPRHVPAKIIAVADIPRTKSGKITELAVRDIIHGKPIKNREALANPEALELFRNLPDLQS